MIVVDTHVHWYDDVSLDALLDAAWTNSRVAAGKIGKRLCVCVLFVADTAAQNSSRRLAGLDATAWQRHQIRDRDDSVLFGGPGDRQVLVVFGQQIVTAERLEVIIAGARPDIPDGLTLFETVSLASAAAPITIVPWAFGKWWGQRGKLVRGVLQRRLTNVFAGDNGIRPRFLWRPSLLKLAAELDIAIFAGTDPLPIPGDHKRCGSYGIALDATVNDVVSWPDILSALQHLRETQVIGYRATWLYFLKCQLALRHPLGAKT